MKKIIKCFFILMLCGILLLGTARRAEAAAEAGALSIVGGSIAAGGIGATLAVIAPPALIILGLAMVAQGIYVNVSEESEALGMTKTDYVGAKLSQFALASGRQYIDVCNDITEGTTIATDGKLILAEKASNVISQFVNSLVANDEIVISGTQSQSKYISIDGNLCPVVSPGEYLEILIDSNGNSYSLLNKGQFDVSFFASYSSDIQKIRIIAFSKAYNFQFDIFENGVKKVNTSVGSVNFNGIYGVQLSYESFIFDTYQALNVPFISGNFIDVLTSLNGNFDIVNSSDDDVDSFVSDTMVDTTVYNPEQGKSNVIDTGFDLDALAEALGRSGTISIENYLDMLQRALNGVESNTIAINDALTGVLENVSVGVYNPVGEATVSKERDEDLPLVFTPVLDLEVNPSGGDAEEALKGLAFDLTDIFPFCIPFDLFALVSKFDVEPVTPQINVSLPLPGVGTTLDLDLDLSPFDTVAAVLRTMELIAFVVGLAMVTRHIIRG